MKNPWIKLLLVAILTALCVWEIAVKEIRLGKDLKGGVSLIYAVSLPGSQPGDEVLGQVIEVLKQRVNPQGVLDIAMQPQGNDRIEVVMPLPSDEVRELQLAAKQKAADFIALTQLSGAATPAFAGTVPLVIAGVIVGIGTRLGSGCTSGHGVCGMSRLSQRSLVATATFMATGFATVAAMNALGLEVLP